MPATWDAGRAPDPPAGFDPTAWRTLLRVWQDAPSLMSVLVGPDHAVAYMNPAVEKVFGGRPLGMPMVEAFPGMDRSALAYFDEVLTAGRSVDVPVRRVGVRDIEGRDVVLRYVLSPLAMPGGPALGVISQAMDVTAEVQLEQQSQRSHEVALNLQRALLPVAPPVFPDREVAGRYLAGVPDVEVGGDWWDVVDMGGGQVALGVGDVSGRGVPAAIVMGQARAAMRATGFAQLEPIEVLNVLDEQLAELVRPKPREQFAAPPRFVTALYGVFEPRNAAIRFSCAGHLPALVRLREGRTRIVDVRPGTPLGLRLGGWTEVTTPLPAGAVVAMFTDGLVESRDQEVDDGLAALCSVLSRVGGSPDLDEVAGELIHAMGRDQGHVDDVALLLMRTHETAYPTSVLDRTVSRLGEIAQARNETVSMLAAAGVGPDQAASAQHLVDELVANALEHAHGVADLHVHVTGARVVVEVTDQVLARPRPRDATREDERGRGLVVTAGLSSRWGVRAGPRGKTVWAEIMRSDGDRPGGQGLGAG